ncbi:hypothetical protein MPS_3010 [Mycobacterium pseudoshottsii JCM 15466]|nr:hypothetical protein MMEU_1437 [Mycobacterium marinum str. Europe]GAQ36137.1 hypothetical protein MPS_3010 [Mycobacterium pseudoshottsii JCM 15466]
MRPEEESGDWGGARRRCRPVRPEEESGDPLMRAAGGAAGGALD